MPLIRALWDRGESSPTYVNLRGNPGSPGALVKPAIPRVFTDESFAPAKAVGENKTGNRLALSRWMTRPDHPLTARVWVNRVWKHHFGIGIVSSLDNFGKLGAAPTHAKAAPGPTSTQTVSRTKHCASPPRRHVRTPSRTHGTAT